MAGLPLPLDRSSANLHHIGMVVDDLERAAEHLASTHGAGPFLAVPHVHLTELLYLGRPCRWEHSLAFGLWGGVQVELQELDAIEPEGLAEVMGRPGQLSHVSYRVDDLAQTTDHLIEHGLERFLQVRSGEVQFACFSDPLMSTYVEVHQANPFIARFDAAVAEAALGWDGRDPLRMLEPHAAERQG